ncbi:unnamed protein product [Acanthoscelides obtectus]|uniref:Uncharacterized protein n=1 Tax=Acanthoscelides obtectus TaxID=200917 RepID=A0A9P0LIW4_ACAOB|nr:unnamed protein product [Acanthoscelides obtectus]CAK1656580.1 hypothetical protein AOBTE_LOCUS19814 [Acanthoscelides obtectus]
MNQGHRPPHHIDHKHRSGDNIAKVKDTRLNMDRKPQVVGSITICTRHTRIIDQKPRPLNTAVPDRQDNTVYTDALSPTDTNATDTSQGSELLELFTTQDNLN